MLYFTLSRPWVLVLKSVGGVSANRNKQGDERMAIRHGTACKSNIPEWAGEGVGIVGIVYLVYAMPTYETVRPGDDQNVGT